MEIENQSLIKNKGFYLLITLLFLFGCNPFPKEDAHPNVPLLATLLKDSTKFKKLIGNEDVSEFIFLKDDRILITPNNSEKNFKIINTDNQIIIEDKYDWKLPFYLDQHGDLYFNKMKYFYPDYKRHEAYKNVVFKDSVQAKYDNLANLNDSLRIQATNKYELELLKSYDLKPCVNSVTNTRGCDNFKIKNNALMVMQDNLYQIDFSKSPYAVEEFDDKVLIAWRNGRLPSPVYMAYYQLDHLKFKCDDNIYPQTIKLKGKNYFYSASLGIYEILL